MFCLADLDWNVTSYGDQIIQNHVQCVYSFVHFDQFLPDMDQHITEHDHHWPFKSHFKSLIACQGRDTVFKCCVECSSYLCNLSFWQSFWKCRWVYCYINMFAFNNPHQKYHSCQFAFSLWRRGWQINNYHGMTQASFMMSHVATHKNLLYSTGFLAKQI